MRYTMKRLFTAALAVAMLLTACGDDEMSLTEYTEALSAIFDRGIARYEEIIDAPGGAVLVVGQGEHFGFDEGGAQLTDFTPQDLHVALEQVAEIQDEALAAAADIEPPAEVAELHALYFRQLPIAELAERAGTASTWEELSASPEMAAYRQGLAADNEVCADFQATLDATAQRGVFEDVPWMPGELADFVDYALGCDSLPANPDDVYRPPGG